MPKAQGSIARTLNEFGRLTRVLVKHPRDGFLDDSTIAAQWSELNFMAPPDLARAIDEFDRFADILRTSGATVEYLPRDERATLDSIYVRDASIVCDRGVILCNMGKRSRSAEPAAQGRAYRDLGSPAIVGSIEEPGRLEGGDVLWLNPRTIVVGRGYRTNGEGISQLRALLGDSIDELIEVALPHWRGAADVLHLMSLVSPLDRDLAVVYSKLLPVPFRERLLDDGFTLVEVPDEEFETMGTNVLALAPRHCLMLWGNPLTRQALELAGVEVIEYEGREISHKGAGGPTCLTRPLARSN
jgi:N-dimethylarginine dimethylaminohydrolase